jgi:predicted secreted protein
MTTGAISGQSITLYSEGCLIAGSKNFSISFSQAMIDVTSREDAFQNAVIAGRRDWKIDIDALYVYTNVGKKVLLANVNAGLAGATPSTSLACVITMVSPDGTFTGEAFVTSFALALPAEDAVTYTCSLQGTGVLTLSVS